MEEQQKYLQSLLGLDWLVDRSKQQEWEAAGAKLGGRELASAVDVQPGNVVSLEGANFLGDKDLGSTLWVHPLFSLLLGKMLTKMAAGNVVYVMGTPGIGKTVLSSLLVTILLLLGFEVIYETHRLQVGKTLASYFKLGEVCWPYFLREVFGTSAPELTIC